MTSALTQVALILGGAIALPLGLSISLAIVRLAANIRNKFLDSRPLPVAVQPLNFEHGISKMLPFQDNKLFELPSRLRDFIADDALIAPTLAAGPINPVSPQLAGSAPETKATTSWATTLQELFFPRQRPAYNVIIVPEILEDHQAVGIQIIHSPRNDLVAAKSFAAIDLRELTFQVGSFVVESVNEQPSILRRSPRWEHWKPGAYYWLRVGIELERQGKPAEAHAAYSKAAFIAPGNTRVALYHGALHEARGEHEEAEQTYNAAACLWRQSIELSFRLASSRVNSITGDEPAAQRIYKLESAVRVLENAQMRMRRRFILRRILRTFRLSRRDKGERRFWVSWLRRDPYRSPLKFLRRSKGYEYKSALTVAILTNKLQLLRIPEWDAAGPQNVSSRDCWLEITKICRTDRSGWLAHWSAACYFSRAISLPEELQPSHEEWTQEWNAIEVGLSRLSLQVDGKYDVPTWKEYCVQRAIAEIGRVLRNPCSQLTPALLQTDPDMIRLQEYVPGKNLGVLAGLGPHNDESVFGFANDRAENDESP